MPRVDRWAEAGRPAADMGGEFVQIGLAEDDGPGGAQAGHGDRVGLCRSRVGKQGARHCGGQAAHVDIVLDHKGDAVERPPEGTLSRFRVAALRFLKRRSGDAQHGVEGAVMEADSLKGVPDERRRGQFPRAQRGCGLCDGDGIQRIEHGRTCLVGVPAPRGRCRGAWVTFEVPRTCPRRCAGRFPAPILTER